MDEDIQLSRHGAVAMLTLSRPVFLNSLRLETVQRLLVKFRGIAEDASVRAVVVIGEGRGFCAGWRRPKEMWVFRKVVTNVRGKVVTLAFRQTLIWTNQGWE
jgi:1,4-dihydroxy-2-naphthoyl-CoA synthase